MMPSNLRQRERVWFRNAALGLLVCGMSACVFRRMPQNEMLDVDSGSAGTGPAAVREDSAIAPPSNSTATPTSNLGGSPPPSTPSATAGRAAPTTMQQPSGPAAAGTTPQAGQGGTDLTWAIPIAGVGGVGIDAGALSEEQLAALADPACGLLLSTCLPLDPGNLKGCVAQCMSGAAGAPP